MLEGREVQNRELKKFSFFRDNFCFLKGHVERLPPLTHRHSGFCSVPWWIFWLNFLEAVFRWYLLLLLQKNTHRKFGEKFGGKIRWNIPFFSAFFGAFFGTFLGAFFGEHIFASKSEKFVQNPFCKRDPLTECHYTFLKIDSEIFLCVRVLLLVTWLLDVVYVHSLSSTHWHVEHKLTQQRIDTIVAEIITY